MRWISVSDLDTPGSPNAELAIEAASGVLWALSGRKFGGHAVVTETYGQRRALLPVSAQYAEGEVRNITTQPPTTGFGVWLRNRPVVAIHSIISNGVVVDPASYRLADGSQVVSTSGGPLCQGENLTITYSYGGSPPAMGKMAATALANELLKAADGDPKCALPSRVTSVSRQGVSWTLLDPQDFLADGRTGIYIVDLFLKSVNPSKALAKSRVFSPDLPRVRATRRTVSMVDGETALSAAITTGQPFNVPLPSVPANTLSLVATVETSDQNSWTLPPRMLTHNTGTDEWSMVGILPSDTRLLPNHCRVDLYAIMDGVVTHVASHHLTRA